MLLQLIGVVFGGSKSETRGNDTFDPVLAVSFNTTDSRPSGSYVGSFARLRKRVTLSKLPFSSKSLVKNRLVSMLTPIAAKTIEKFSSCPSCTSLVGLFTRPACRQIWAAISLWGRPAAEKIGIFCPRAIEFMVSMADIPVAIISSG